MSVRRVMVFYDMLFVPTPQGVQQVSKSFSGICKDEEHFQVVSKAIEDGKGFWLYATREEMIESGLLSAQTWINPKDTKWIVIKEESELDLKTKPPGNVNLRKVQ